MNFLQSCRKIISLLVLFVISLLAQISVLAQNDSVPAVATPTIAPTKTLTPSAPPLSPEATSNSISSDSVQPFQAFTQGDLSTLTGNIQRPNGLLWYNDKLYSSCSGDWTVYEIDAATGETAQYIYGVKNAHTLIATGTDLDFSLWIPDFQSNTVTQVSKGISKNISTNLNGPWGISVLETGQFLVSNLHTNDVVLLDGTSSVEVIKNLRSPTGLVADSDFIYVANTGSARRAIEWFKLDDTISSSAPIDASDNSISHSLVTGLQNVTSLVMAGDGHLYFSYALGTRGIVGRIDPNACRNKGGCSNSEIDIVLYTEMAAPLAGLTISSDLVLYVHSIYSPDIYWVDLKSNVRN
ncbi:MAG: hypothetical protein R3E39_03220 [Anaerolineae bacterium]